LEASSLFFVSNDVVNEGTDIRTSLGEFIGRLEFYNTKDEIPSLSTEGSARNSDSESFDDGGQLKELITSAVRWVNLSYPGC
jgi:hypothetical protein